MVCKRYEDWLMDAALGPLAPEREAELRAHVEGCAACRAKLDRRRQLVAAMDQAVAASVSAEPSPEFLARVRQRIAEQPAPAPGWFAGWLPVTAGALAAVALLVFWLLPRQEPARPGPVVTPPTMAGRLPPKAPPTRGELKKPPVPVRGPRGSVRAPAGVQPPREPEVLVPPEQRAGVEWLYNALQRQPERTTAVLVRQVQAEAEVAQPLRVSELSIAPLQIGPIKISEPATPLQR